MVKPHAILLVPADGDPHGLLADGVCGARPPTVMTALPMAPGAMPLPVNTRALVLAWDGAPVAEGLDRLYRATGIRAFYGCDGIPGVAAVAQAAQDAGFGTIVLLDAEGRELTEKP